MVMINISQTFLLLESVQRVKVEESTRHKLDNLIMHVLDRFKERNM